MTSEESSQHWIDTLLHVSIDTSCPTSPAMPAAAQPNPAT
jgi:hypothetical protein